MTREEIQTRIWSANTFVDFDHNLHNAIARIREVLGDSAENPRYIETLPRRGYRYIGPVQDFQKPQLATETGDHTAQPVSLMAPPKRKRSLVLILCALLALGLVALTPGGTSTRKRRLRRYVPLLSCPSRISPAIRQRNFS